MAQEYKQTGNTKRQEYTDPASARLAIRLSLVGQRKYMEAPAYFNTERRQNKSQNKTDQKRL